MYGSVVLCMLMQIISICLNELLTSIAETITSIIVYFPTVAPGTNFLDELCFDVNFVEVKLSDKRVLGAIQIKLIRLRYRCA